MNRFGVKSSEPCDKSMETIPPNTLDAIKSIIIQAGEYAMQQPVHIAYQLKADRSPFTQVELMMEEMIISFLQTEFPDHQVISEEKGISAGDNRYRWFLDPIDGTKMYLIGAPTWGISLGLLVEGKPTLGFFYLTKSRDLFWGGPGYGAFWNEIPLNPNLSPEPDNPLVFFGVPSNFHRRYEISFPRVRVLGSTAIHLAYVASGVAIGALARRVHLWDLAGMLPVLSQTGVKVEFLSGDSFSPHDYLDGSQLPDALLVSRQAHMEMLRGMIKRK